MYGTIGRDTRHRAIVLARNRIFACNTEHLKELRASRPPVAGEYRATMQSAVDSKMAVDSSFGISGVETELKSLVRRLARSKIAEENRVERGASHL